MKTHISKKTQNSIPSTYMYMNLPHETLRCSKRHFEPRVPIIICELPSLLSSTELSFQKSEESVLIPTAQSCNHDRVLTIKNFSYWTILTPLIFNYCPGLPKHCFGKNVWKYAKEKNLDGR